MSEQNATDRTRTARALVARVLETRRETEKLCAPLEADDFGVQTMPDVSPPRWHLAHTTWFFEAFVLARALDDYAPFHPRFAYLFNSYYEGVGERVARDKRGTLSRPTTREIMEYRRHVDARLLEAFAGDAGAARARSVAAELELGIHHEQQHQELLVTDIKHILASNPLRPAYAASPASTASVASVASDQSSASPLAYAAFDAGVRRIGAEGTAFAFDNERPRHSVYVERFAIASRPATCAEWLAFMNDGGYARPELWLSDGWAAARREGWQAPLYWERANADDDGDAWSVATMAGLRAVDPNEAVCHVSYFEADAFARWSRARLPTEAEWEVAAATGDASAGHFADSRAFHPRASSGSMFGDVWQWTSSAYEPYPGFAPLEGALGEYNGKFMCGQQVLRGGSCATPRSHVRATYRNFFPPSARWQFTGVRLARSLGG